MANNKIIANGETLIDLTADTVTAGTMVSGTTAHDRSGASITGTFDPSVYVLKAGDTMTGALNFGTTGKISSTELKINDRNILDEFKAYTQYFSTEIPANADLKTTAYLIAGRYFCASSATVATFSNCPTTDAFEMDVDYPISTRSELPPTGLSAYIQRTITAYNGAQWFQYVNRNSSGTYTWNDWVKLRATTNNGNVIKQIGSTGNYEYRVLLSETNSNDTLCERIRKSGGLTYNPASGAVYIRRQHSATATNSSSLVLGNSTADGTAGASYGTLYIYGKGTKYARFQDSDNVLTANRIYTLPNEDGMLAIKADHVLKAGDRMSGSLNIDNAIMNIHRTCGVDMYLQAYSTGNQGLYSSGYYTDATDTSTYTLSGKWIIRRNSAGNVYVDEWASIGSASKPVYFSSSGRPVEGNEIVSTSKSAASGGTDLSLVTTGEKYTWNSKTSNTGTVTSVAVSGSKGISISGSPITSSGTVTVSVDTTSGTATRNTTNTSSGTLTYVRYGKVVYIYGDFSLSTSSTDKTVFTGLPAPEKANCYITSLGPTATDGGSVFKINSSGQLLTALRTAKTGNNYISATYIADY